MIKVIYEEYSQMVHNPLILLFFTTIVADFLTGISSAWYRGELDSQIGFRGTSKHLGLTIVVLLFYPYLGIFDLTEISYPFLFNFIGVNGISIIENLDEMGINMPSDLAKHLKRLTEKDKEEEEGQ